MEFSKKLHEKDLKFKVLKNEYYSLLAQQLYKTTLYRTQIQRGKKKA
jgi:hypothetical protein